MWILCIQFLQKSPYIESRVYFVIDLWKNQIQKWKKIKNTYDSDSLNCKHHFVVRSERMPFIYDVNKIQVRD